MRPFRLLVDFISWKSRGEELPVLEEWLTGPRGRGNAPVPRDIVQSVSRALKLMDIIGSEPGLTVKQMARRLDLNPTTAYHLVRTLVYEGYLIRDDLGNYSMGPAVADRYRDLARALRGPDSVVGVLRRAAAETGYSHYLARFVGNRVCVTAVAEGPHSPWLEDLIPGFDDGAHATALGKALLATLEPHRRERYLRESGMRKFTDHTLTDPVAFEHDIANGRRLGMQTEINQFRVGVSCAAVPVVETGDLAQRTVLGCALPTRDFMHSAKQVRARLHAYGQMLQEVIKGEASAAA
jgi:DNA-binding IclR family transcriptional regulator